MRWWWVCDVFGWGKGGVKVRVGVSGYSGRGFYGSINFLAYLLEL